MAFRSKTPAVALLILAFGMPLEAAEPLVFQVRHRHLRRGAEGSLRVGDDGITFAEAGRSKAHSRQWRFEEIEQLTLSPDTLRILTYEDQHMRFGRDREFVFDALPKDLAARLYPFFSRRLDQRFVAALAVDPINPLWETPARLLHRAGSAQGSILVGAERVVFAAHRPAVAHLAHPRHRYGEQFRSLRPDHHHLGARGRHLRRLQRFSLRAQTPLVHRRLQRPLAPGKPGEGPPDFEFIHRDRRNT